MMKAFIFEKLPPLQPLGRRTDPALFAFVIPVYDLFVSVSPALFCHLFFVVCVYECLAPFVPCSQSVCMMFSHSVGPVVLLAWHVLVCQHACVFSMICLNLPITLFLVYY